MVDGHVVGSVGEDAPTGAIHKDLRRYFAGQGGVMSLAALPDPEECLTLQEYLERDQSLQRMACESLPGRFDRCTWELSGISQPLYVCRECVVGASEPAVICYSCSIACHPKCNLVELLEKRNLRCDCGNGLFKGSPPLHASLTAC